MVNYTLLLVLISLLQLKDVFSNTLPLVKIPLGLLQGTYLSSANGRKFAAFQGIPYADPPTGDLRFKVSEPRTTLVPLLYEYASMLHVDTTQ